MEFIDAILLHIGSDFSRDAYMRLTKIQGILWSIANTVIVFYFLKITGLVRTRHHGKAIRYRYFFLLMTVILSPFLLITDSGTIFFTLEAAIYGIQYMILLYTLVLERKTFMKHFREIVTGENEKTHLQSINTNQS